MITPSFGLTATERVLPKLALDFTTASLDSRVTFTRTTDATHPATYVNSSGVVTAATNNQPRFDYDPVTLACKGLLIEESRGNLLTRSNEFDTGVTWVPTGATVSANVAVSPDGTTNADKLVAAVSAGSASIRETITVTSSVAQTLSVYAKAGEFAWMVIYEGYTGKGRYFDIANGVVGGVFTAAPTTSTITDCGNGWFRCTITVTSVSTNGQMRIFIADADGNATITSNDGSGIYLYGAQWETGAFATSYIPTTSAALTRNADVAVMTGTNFSDWFNASEGTFVVKTGTLNGSSASGFSVDNGTSSNQIIVPYNNSKCFVVLNGGAVQVNAGGSIASGNCSVIYKANDFYTARNAGGADTDTSGTVPTVSQLGVGCRPYGPSFFANGCIQQIDYWPMRLLNAEGLAISK